MVIRCWRALPVPLGLGLLVIVFMASLTDYGDGQELNKAAIKHSSPDVYLWTSVSNYDPYVPLSQRQRMLSEYIIAHMSYGVVPIHIVYYNPSTVIDPSEQSAMKEYYWKYLNSTGVSPGATLFNTTLSYTVPFSTKPDDVIAYHAVVRVRFQSHFQMPTYDFQMEYPTNTGHIKRFISLVEVSTFPLIRWRYASESFVHMRSWEEIVSDCMSLRPAFPSPVDESEATYHSVSPQDIRMLENSCTRDLFAFYLIVQQRKDHQQTMHWGPLTRVYFSVPLVMTDTGPDWIDITEAFCLSYPSDCASIENLILTNAHLLAVSNRGIFVSEVMTSAPLRFLEYPDLPLLAFHLIDPCSQIRDLFYCYTEFGVNPLVHSVRLHYVPVCYIQQTPNFQDIVILVISHDMIDEDKFLRNKVAWTVLYAEQPYTEWQLLVKNAIKFDLNLIHNLKAAYYNHQLNHFDFVAQVGDDQNPVSAHIFHNRWYVRFTLARPRKTQKPGHYDVLSTELGNGFLPKVFPTEFEFRKIEVSVGSFDIHFIGNQIWIAQSGGRFVYLSVGYLPSEIEYCNFNHPDRYFICVNVGRNEIYVGKVSSIYRAHVIRVDDLPEVREIAIDQGWFIAPSSRFDSKLTRFVNPAYSSTEGRIFQFLMGPVVTKALAGVFYRVTYQGNIQIWYMDAAIKYDKAIVPDVPKVRHYKEALWIATGDKRDVSQYTKTQVFDEANQLVLANLPAYQKLFDKKIAAKSTITCRMAIVTIKADSVLPFEPQVVHSALAPFLVDGISVALYQARIPGKPYGFTRTDVGSTITCRGKLHGGKFESTCALYIRNIKFLDDNSLPGYSAVAYAYVLKSIPMHAYGCPSKIHINPRSNDLFEYTLPDGSGGVCDAPSRGTGGGFLVTDFIGWSVYYPGHFSGIVVNPDQFTPNDANYYKITTTITGTFYMKATTTFDRSFELDVTHYEGFLINLSSIEFQDSIIPPVPDDPTPHSDLYKGLPAWDTRPGECLFELSLLANPVLKSSGGVIALDLHDAISFSTSIHAILPLGEVMMQQVRLKVTNSNPVVLGLRQTLTKRLTSQTLDITVKPTGFSTGQASVVVRALSCLPTCKTPCSLTFIFQVMRAAGKRLTIHYPINVPVTEILNPDAAGLVYRNNSVIYMRLPVNYRPPSIHGVDIPMSEYIYNADPSKPMYRTTYKVSKVSGQYKKCKDKVTRAECECSQADLLEDHPAYTDCRQMIYRVRRATQFLIRATYAQVMQPADQHQAFFLEKSHLVVWVEEVNGRQDYTLVNKNAEHNPYLEKINADIELSRGKRFYNSEDLEFTTYGTGVYHFRVALGEFDTFDDVSGYFLVYSEEFGMDDFSFMLYFFGAVMVCFLGTLCGFLRVRKRLVGHIPIREIVDEGKTKVD